MKRNELARAVAEIVEELPEDTSWEELGYEIFVRQKIERGLEDIRGGRSRTSEEVREQFGITE